MNRLTPEDARWVALMLDTEGNINVSRYCKKTSTARGVPQFTVQLSVVNTDYRLLAEFARITGHDQIYPQNKISRDGYRRRPAWMWRVARNGPALSLLEDILPHLISKQLDARAAMVVLRNRGRLSHEQRDLLEKCWAVTRVRSRDQRYERLVPPWLIAAERSAGIHHPPPRPQPHGIIGVSAVPHEVTQAPRTLVLGGADGRSTPRRDTPLVALFPVAP